MRYATVCSGIEAPTVAWHGLGWEPQWFSENEPFPCSVLAHHYPDVPNLGDMTKIDTDRVQPIDLLCGGTPCQSFSVAGLRNGLADPRGNMALVYIRLVDALRPRWVVWENVPGVLSSGGGRDFSSILGALAELGYGWAYRVLDAQYWGVAQRRRHVFVIGYLGGWQRAAAVLFDTESVRGNTPPRREAGEEVAGVLSSRASGGGGGPGAGTDEAASGYLQAVQRPATVAPTLNTHFSDKQGLEDQHVNGGCGLFVPSPVLAFSPQSGGDMRGLELRDTVQLQTHQVPGICSTVARRLTPRECERLQGFPDDYTLVPHRGKPAKDTPRYKALGNSMAVPVVRWIGERIQAVEMLNRP